MYYNTQSWCEIICHIEINETQPLSISVTKHLQIKGTCKKSVTYIEGAVMTGIVHVSKQNKQTRQEQNISFISATNSHQLIMQPS